MIADPVLVTGASGFIGSHLVRFLAASGAAVTGLGCSRNPVLEGARVTGARADLRDGRALARLFAATPFRTVFHLAAQGVRQEDDGGADTVEANAAGAFHLARAALSAGVERFVYCGSACEYRPQQKPIPESAPLGAQTLYGASKAAGWVLLDYLSRMEGLPLITVRPSSVYGPGESHTKLLPYVIRSALRGRHMQITAGTQVRDYLYVSDVVEALRLAAARATPGEVFNLGAGPGGARTVRSIVDAVLEITGASPSLAHFGDAVRARVDVPYLVCDSSLACARLGWKQSVSFDTGLRKSIEYYRSHCLEEEPSLASRS